MKNLCNFLISLREEYLAKRACEKHMLEAKESYRTVVFASVSWVRSSREIPVKLSAWKIFSVIFLPFTYTIYTLIIHKSMQEAIQREKPQIVVLQHNTPIFQRESYSSLVRNHCSLFSFPLPLSYLERRFVLKHNPHIFKVQRVFWSLGSFGDLSKEAGKAWLMQSGVLWDPKSQKRHDSEKSVGSRSLEGSNTLGRLGLEGLLLFVYSNFILQWINFDLEGRREIFCRVLRFPLR